VSNSAQAASFTTNFGVNFSPEGNVTLKSITQNNQTISNFSFVNKVQIKNNTPIILNPKIAETSNPELAAAQNIFNNNTGAGSTDKGDQASSPLEVSGLNNPTGAEIAAYLGNNNLSNIVDTEDNGSFGFHLFFDSLIQEDNSGLDSVFFWERGINSDLTVQAIDGAGNLIGNSLKLNRQDQKYAGYFLDTLEISLAQPVGSWGVSLQQLGVNSLSGLFISADASHSGPDYKIIARKTVPEPTTLLGLGVVAGLGFLSRRRFNQISAGKIA
jgi:hypothetical protein